MNDIPNDLLEELSRFLEIDTMIFFVKVSRNIFLKNILQKKINERYNYDGYIFRLSYLENKKLDSKSFQCYKTSKQSQKLEISGTYEEINNILKTKVDVKSLFINIVPQKNMDFYDKYFDIENFICHLHRLKNLVCLKINFLFFMDICDCYLTFVEYLPIDKNIKELIITNVTSENDLHDILRCSVEQMQHELTYLTFVDTDFKLLHLVMKNSH